MESRPRGRARSGSPSPTPSTPQSSDTRPRRPPRSFAAEAPIVTRPADLPSKVGGEGFSVRIYSNHFKLQTPDDVIIYDYHVDFEPNLEAVRLRRTMIYQNREMFNSAYIYDGGSNIKSLQEITDPIEVTSECRQTSETIKIKIKPTTRIVWGHPEMMRFYNTQMKRNLFHIGLKQIGRNFFDQEAAINLKNHGIEIWPGILTAINEHDGGILMVANALNKIIRKETARDILRKMFTNDFERFKRDARRELAGQIVMSSYNTKTYRVDDIIFDKNPETYTFERQGQSISLKDYYASQYNAIIQDDRQPLLLVRPTEKQRRGGLNKDIVLIPELCLLTGLTDHIRADLQLRRAMDQHIHLEPQVRMRSLQTIVSRIANHPKVIEEMEQWNLKLDTNLTQVTGRVLPPERILMADFTNEQAIMAKHPGSFETDIRSERMRKPVALEYWVIVAQRNDKNLIESYLDNLRRVSGPLGIIMTRPMFIWVDDHSTSTYLDSCRRIPDQAKMVHIVVPNNNRERYSSIKRFFCCEHPCPSQVLTNRVLNKNQLAVATKLVLQMSVKMGAQAWALIIPPRNTMIVGYNTYRDTARRNNSVGAFVCSTNPETTAWYSRVSYHKTIDEMSCNFATNLKSGLKSWYSINRRFPEKIIIYRDGVSEGQIGYIYTSETKRISEILGSHRDLRESLWCFIIVNKRVNARFFVKPGPNDPVKNPIPGTVVDSVVTRQERYDFYLVSQSVRFGTVNPTMYNIIVDNTCWKPMHHQALAYKLCHLYYNWAGTISVPAPCHYAYKLAFLVGTCIHAEPSLELSNQLFYL